MPDNKFVALLEAIVPGGRSVKVGGKIYDLTDKPREYLQKSPKRFPVGRVMVEVTLDDKGKIQFMQPTEQEVPKAAREQAKPVSSPPPTAQGGSDFNVSLWQTCLNCATQIVASTLSEENAKMKSIRVLIQADYLYSISVMKRDGADIVAKLADEALVTSVVA